jgi:hypothetical protein
MSVVKAESVEEALAVKGMVVLEEEGSAGMDTRNLTKKKTGLFVSSLQMRKGTTNCCCGNFSVFWQFHVEIYAFVLRIQY